MKEINHRQNQIIQLEKYIVLQTESLQKLNQFFKKNYTYRTFKLSILDLAIFIHNDLLIKKILTHLPQDKVDTAYQLLTSPKKKDLIRKGAIPSFLYAAIVGNKRCMMIYNFYHHEAKIFQKQSISQRCFFHINSKLCLITLSL